MGETDNMQKSANWDIRNSIEVRNTKVLKCLVRDGAVKSTAFQYNSLDELNELAAIKNVDGNALSNIHKNGNVNIILTSVKEHISESGGGKTVEGYDAEITALKKKIKVINEQLDNLKAKEIHLGINELNNILRSKLKSLKKEYEKELEQLKKERDKKKAEQTGDEEIDKGTGKDDEKYIEWLIQIEAPYKDSDYILDSSGKRIAIKPHNANDGYVTVGYGHAIQSDTDAKKYGFNTGSKQAVSTVVNSITELLNKYKSYKDNPAILTIQEAKDLLKDDLVNYQTKAFDFAKETGLTFSQNELDGITSLVYNGNRAYDPDSLLYYFLRKDKQGAMNVLHKAVGNGWYGSNQGLLRRRLMEFNIFFNNDYTFYDSHELDKLKKDVGF